MVFASINYFIYGEEEKHTVLLLNSYHANFTWTSQMTTVILEKFSGSDLDLLLHAEHMDWKNFPTDKNIKSFYDLCKEKYKNKTIDVIIATDDKAIEFALEHRKELFSNAPIVFAGTTRDQEIIQDNKNITGVTEYIDLKQTIAMALEINPSMEQLHVIYEQTESGQSTYDAVRAVMEEDHPNIEMVSITGKTNADTVAEVETVEDGAILILTQYQDSMGQAMEFEQYSQMISDASKVPVFHMYAATMGHGNMGGAMLSSETQGEYAADLAISILKGKQADDIPIIRDAPMKLAFDYIQLERFGIPLKFIPDYVEIINEPFSFFKTYKKIVIIWLLVIAVLIGFIITLTIYSQEIRRTRNKLQVTNGEITMAYEELTASEEELQQQLEEISSMQNKLREMVYYDVLTDLPNKRALEEDFSSFIFNCGGGKSGVIFIDADNFKLINDTLGHSIGDYFIIQIGERLRALISEHVRVYRMGGDEFIVLVSSVNSKQDIEDIAMKIMKSFERGFPIQNMMIHTTVSAGIAMYPDHGHTIDELVKGADIAMYKAKDGGKGQYVFYNEQMNQEMIEKAAIQANLGKAMERDEFSLHYQPQYDFNTNEIIGFEALLRWDNKELGPVPPFKFIKVAEDSRLIIPLGKWVLESACSFIKKIHELDHGDYTISVNVSLLQAMQEDFVDFVLETLQKNNLKAIQLEIEMTETMLIQNFNLIEMKLNMLREKGVRVALDDFGTGYSSLNYLNRLPIDTLKIDKSFVDNIFSSVDGENIIETLITLGHGRGLDVVAEGVETYCEYNYLKSNGCDYLQGYLFSKPLPEDEIIKLIETVIYSREEE